jgi:ABC-type glycerol-3-phosphate transport system substrate-binding protein
MRNLMGIGSRTAAVGVLALAAVTLWAAAASGTPAKGRAAAAPGRSPGLVSQLAAMHPLLYTLHVWLWFPNPSGLYASTNPYAAAFNRG